MVVTGLILGLVGADVNSGVYRFSFGSFELTEGIEFVAVAMGLFALTDIVNNIDQNQRELSLSEFRNLWLSAKETRRPSSRRSRHRGRSFLGLCRGRCMISSFASYAIEERLSKSPHEFGQARWPVLPARKQPTTPARRRRSSPC